jgi:hypothetical protein
MLYVPIAKYGEPPTLMTLPSGARTKNLRTPTPSIMRSAMTALGIVLAMFGLSLAVGITVSVRVYGPPKKTLPVFKAVANFGIVVGIAGAILAVVGWARGAPIR